MLFNSIAYLLFLPIVFTLYWFVFNKKITYQNILLLISSYFFYGWWSWQFLLLLAASTLLDFLYGFGVATRNKSKAKLFLWLSIINNLGILGVFKYYNFFALQFQNGFAQLGVHINPTLLHVALPVGISFYTFHGMSYVFDIYRKEREPVQNFIEYAVFVSFFPLLVAGPIERANHLLPQVQRKRKFSYTQAAQGTKLILWGMLKKVVIADTLSTRVDELFGNYKHQPGITLIMGVIAFSFQIYGDFSGYSDIAIGSAKLFGFELLSNFKFPYFSRDLAEFWRRWHISLSSWFKDYLYIPLGGSKGGKGKAVRNTFIIFLVSGFWHGASWNFIAWGFLHACGFMPLLLLGRNRKHVSNPIARDTGVPGLKELLQMLATFIYVSFAWIFFRANTMAHAMDYIKHIALNLFNDTAFLHHLWQDKKVVVYVLPLLLMEWWLRHDERILKLSKYKWLNWMIITVLTLLIINYFFYSKAKFIYFQF